MLIARYCNEHMMTQCSTKQQVQLPISCLSLGHYQHSNKTEIRCCFLNLCQYDAVILHKTQGLQEAHLSQRGRAMLMSLKLLLSHSRSLNVI